MPKRADDSDLEDRPQSRRRPGKKKTRKRRTPLALILGLSIGGFVLLVGGGVAIILLVRDRSAAGPPPPGPFPNMLAHWSFDELRTDPATEITTVLDGSGRGNNGVLTGGRIAAGRKGNALWLDGRDDQYLDVSGNKDLNFAEGSEFTVAAWYQTKERVGTILAFRNSQRKTQLDLYVRDNHLLGIIGGDEDTGPEHAFIWCDPVNDGGWHHAALTRSGKFIELFYDGVEVGKDARGVSGGRITSDMRYIGCNLKFNDDEKKIIRRVGFKGAIDEVYVFSRALKWQEIQALMKR
jgi:Concanavalin A-like lectin/glucanases superfamily